MESSDKTATNRRTNDDSEPERKRNERGPHSLSSVLLISIYQTTTKVPKNFRISLRALDGLTCSVDEYEAQSSQIN